MAVLSSHCFAASTISWADLAKGARLPRGNSVTITGRLSDLRRGSMPVSDAMEVTGITVSYNGRSSAAAISGSNWSVSVGPLAANTAVSLQLSIAGRPRQSQSFAAGISPIEQSIELTQGAVTQDLSKYAGFDAGVLQSPRTSELRPVYLIHAYPWGPVDLETTGHVPFAQRWSLAVGMPVGSGQTNREFVYGVGFRLNKYFHFTAGTMISRDASSGRLRGAFCFGPSIEITALPGLTSIFASQ